MSSPIKRTISIEIELPFALRIADGIYDCKLDGCGFCVVVKCVEHPNPAVPLPPGKKEGVSVIFTPFTGAVTFHSDADAPEGLNRHSRVEVTFFHLVEDQEVTNAEEAKYKEDTRRFLNAFLNSYRYVFGDSLVRPLSPAEFFGVRFGFGLRFRMASEASDTLPKFRIGTSFGDYPIVTKQWTRVIEQELEGFRMFLKTNSAPPLPAILLLNAAAYVARGEYRLAVVEGGSALDISVEDAGLRVLIGKGQKRDEAMKTLEKMFTTSIVNTILPSSQWDISSLSEWSEYSSTLKLIRNSVVHDAKDPNKVDAERFLAVVTVLTEKLRQ